MRKFYFLLALAALCAPAAAQQDPLEALRRELPAIEAAAAGAPLNARLRARLGFAYSDLGRVNEAQAAFEAAVRLDPKLAEAHYMLGLIYEKKNLNEMAAAAWQACLDHAADEEMRKTARRHLHRLKK